jgi:hypothetical protein
LIKTARRASWSWRTILSFLVRSFSQKELPLVGRNHPLIAAFAAVRSWNMDHPAPRGKDARLDQKVQQIL